MKEIIKITGRKLFEIEYFVAGVDKIFTRTVIADSRQQVCLAHSGISSIIEINDESIDLWILPEETK